MNMRKWWLSNQTFTIYAETDDNGVITSIAPIGRNWIGRNIVDFIKWCRVDQYEELK